MLQKDEKLRYVSTVCNDFSVFTADTSVRKC